MVDRKFYVVRCIDALVQISFVSEISTSSDADMGVRKACLARKWRPPYAVEVVLIFQKQEKCRS